MPVTVRMPQLGETVTEGTILRWAKQPGDPIAEDEVLLEVSTDKVDTEVPSPAAGVVLEILVPAGQTVPVGTPLAIVGSAGELPAAAAPPVAAAAVTPPAGTAAGVEATARVEAEDEAVEEEEAAEEFTSSAAAPPAGNGFLSPVVRKLAGEYGLDLTRVPGTGRDGRITRKDVQAFIDARAREQAPAAPAPAAPAPAAPAAAPPVTIPPAPAPAMPFVEILPAAPAAEPAAELGLPKRVGLGRGLNALIPIAAPPPAAPAPPAAAPEAKPALPPAPPAAPSAAPVPGIPLRPRDRVEEPSRLRLRIAEHMVANRRTAAHVWTAVEVDFEAVERVRRRHQAAFKEREGFSLTYLPFIARATVDALNAFPVVNSSLYPEDRKAVFHMAVNLGIAVDLDQRGLIVMNIPGADGMRMRELARRIRQVADKARRGDLTPDDAAGSTFTITNPGPYGSFMSAPIINVPEVAILSTDTVTKRPVVVSDPAGGDAIAVHHVGYLGLTWDHRAFDGSTAVLFLAHIKESLQSRDWELELA